MQETTETGTDKNKPQNAKPAKGEKAPVPDKAKAGPGGKSRKQKRAYMYVGPNAPGGKLFSGNCYKDGLPEHYNEYFGKPTCPCPLRTGKNAG